MMQQSLDTVHLAMTKQNKTSDKTTNWPVLKTILIILNSYKICKSITAVYDIKNTSSYPSVHHKHRRDSVNTRLILRVQIHVA